MESSHRKREVELNLNPFTFESTKGTRMLLSSEPLRKRRERGRGQGEEEQQKKLWKLLEILESTCTNKSNQYSNSLLVSTLAPHTATEWLFKTIKWIVSLLHSEPSTGFWPQSKILSLYHGLEHLPWSACPFPSDLCGLTSLWLLAFLLFLKNQAHSCT